MRVAPSPANADPVAARAQAVTIDEQTMARSDFISFPSVMATAAGLLQGLFSAGVSRGPYATETKPVNCRK
jgi:hypothetical protein